VNGLYDFTCLAGVTMPVCEGRSGGPGIALPCPENRRDNTVRSRQGDLFLCDACTDDRFPPSAAVRTTTCESTVKDNGVVSSPPNCVTTDTTVVACSDILTPVQCELLCFLVEKLSVMTADHIVKICCDFYRKEEVMAARALIEQFVPQRVPRRKGADIIRATVEDLLKICADPNVKLPVFYAASLRRLPPVDASHCDVSAILKELQALRAEVREISDLRSEIAALKSIVATKDLSLLELKSIRDEVHGLANVQMELQFLKAEVREISEMRSEVGDVKASLAAKDACLSSVRNELLQLSKAQKESWESQVASRAIPTQPNLDQTAELIRQVNELKTSLLKHEADHLVAFNDLRCQLNSATNALLPTATTTSSADTVAGNSVNATEHISFAGLAKDLITTPGGLQRAATHSNNNNNNTRHRRVAICGKAGSDTSSLVAEGIRRAHIFVSRLRPDTDSGTVITLVKDVFPACDMVKAEKLETKFDTYASFRVELYAKRSNFDDLLTSIYDEDSWPSGILVRRFYRTNTNNGVKH